MDTSDPTPAPARTWLPSPGRALVVALGASLLLAVSSAQALRLANRRTGEFAERERLVHALTAEIRYLDEVLTMSANMSAATGEGRWKERYDRHVMELDRAIKDLRQVAPLLFDRELGADTDAANLRLVAMETRVFELVAYGRGREARAILDGRDYARDKALYAAGNQRAQAALIEWAARENLRIEASFAGLAGASLGFGLVAALAWILFMRKSRDERARVELEQARARSTMEQAANHAKSTFLAHMSHELRTPLTAILGHAELLRDGAGGEAERATALETIHRNGEYLLAIINDILDLSKIEAGAMAVERLPVDPARVVEEVVSLMSVRARAKALSFERVYASALPRSIQSDALRLRQILINLVGNAIKFTERGSVGLRVELVTRGARPPELVFAVSDTGIGMSAEQLARVFRPFAQGDQTTTRRFGGTGLGLAICRRLAEMLGAELLAESELARGSTFTLRLILAPAEALDTWRPDVAGDEPRPALPREDARASGAGRLAGARLLLVEDGPDNQRLIALYLQRAGAEVEVAADGRAGIDALAACGAAFDAVLMDMQMPVLDGYAATRAIRARGARVPVIALTAHTMEGDRERCLAAGCDDFLSKPVDRQALLAACETWVARGRERAALVSAPGDGPGSGAPAGAGDG
jgi:signal transduction histidine kinase/ActR/RegA family two-component response regulator